MTRPLNVIFVHSGNDPLFPVSPFIRRQATSLEKLGVNVSFYPVVGKGWKGYLRNVWPLRRKLRMGGYDLIHAHYTLCGWVAAMASRKIPLVVSYMGSDTYGAVDGKRGTSAKSLFLIAQGALLTFFCDAIIVKSDNLFRRIILKRKATIIPNGVDFETFRPAPVQEARNLLGLDPGRKYLLFLGNPSDPRKNFQLASEGFRLIRNDFDAELLAPYPVAPEKVPLYLNAADLLLMTSLLEGSSNVIKEAMACNCPVIATNAGDATLTIGKANQCYITGYCAPEVAGRIRNVLKQGTRSDGREHIRHLEDSVVAGKILEVYQKIRMS